MDTNLLAAASALSDHELLSRLNELAAKERRASIELIAHLAVLDTRPILYAADGYGSLFNYCTQGLRLSEDAACNRIDAARACRRFPPILDLLATGALSLTSVRLLNRHLTPANCHAVLERAQYKSRREIEALVAELAPQPDVPSTVRRLPARVTPEGDTQRPTLFTDRADSAAEPPITPPSAPPRPESRPILQPLAPARYRVQFTIGDATQEKLRRLQALLRREIPDGDPAAIFDRAISVLLDKVEGEKLGRTKRPRRPPIRPRTDEDASEGVLPPRDPANAVKRDVWSRDEGRCAFVSPQGRRCSERAFLEFHHQRPYALRGEASADNIALRCRLHNQYEAQLVFTPPSS